MLEIPKMNFRSYSIAYRGIIFHILTLVGSTAMLSPRLQWLIASAQSDEGVVIQSPKVQ